MSSRSYLSIGDVLSLLREEFPDVTISKIRFLESQGLVDPERSASGYRKFYEHDVERLRWVLRQQREHFLPLKVIRDRLAAAGNGVPSDEPYDMAPAGEATEGAAGGIADLSPVVGEADVADVGELASAGEPGDHAASAPGPGHMPERTVVERAAPVTPVGHASRAAVGRDAAPREPSASGEVETAVGAAHAPRPEPPEPPSTAVHARGGEPGTELAHPGAGAGAGATGTRTTTGIASGPHVAGTSGAGGPVAAAGGAPAGNGVSGARMHTPAHAAEESPREPETQHEQIGQHAPVSAAAGGGGAAGPVPPGGQSLWAPQSQAAAGVAEPTGAVRHAAEHGPTAARLEGAGAASVDTKGVVGGEDTGAAGVAPSGAPADVLSPSVSGVSLTLEELCAATGLSGAQVASLESFGLVRPQAVAGAVYYDEEALTVAKLVVEFGRFGIEPRHLRLYRNAVDREVGLVEQVIMPLLRQRNPEARQRAIESAADLVRLGQGLRAALVRTELRRQLGT